MRYTYLLILSALLSVTIFSCLDKDYYPIDIPLPNPSLSIPLVHINGTIGELVDVASDNTRIGIDTDGKLTLYYEGQVIKRTSSEVFPPIPWFADFPIADTISPLPLPLDSEFIIQKAVFKGSIVFFKFKSNLQEDIFVNMKMPELSKNGEVFEHDFEMIYDGSGFNYFESELISLDGYDVDTDDSNIYFQYDARTAAGDRIVLDEAYMNIDVIRFSYMEGFFGERSFALQGSAIPIGIFNTWISGGFSFDQPKLTISVDNSFGFPVTTYFSRLDLSTLSGNSFEIESSVIDDGIEFAYPEISELGEIKSTSFTIDASNSNIEDVFNEKATQLNYDIEAIANPNDLTIVGFFEESSFFSINTAVEVPLHVNIQDLILSDVYTFDLSEFDKIKSGEVIVAIKNALPLNAEMQLLFEDSAGVYQDYILSGAWSQVNANDQAGMGYEAQSRQVFRYPIDETKWEKLRQSNKIKVNLKLNTENAQADEYIWIYDYQGLDLSISATINQ